MREDGELRFAQGMCLMCMTVFVEKCNSLETAQFAEFLVLDLGFG